MGLYDEVEIEDMDWDQEMHGYTYSCPCGDLFQITVDELLAGEDIARCPSCSLFVQVIYDQEDIVERFGKKAERLEEGPPAIAVT
ncbi:g2224 [Coccomyxa viridis]|uniref:Diphthamide biosynthesis protein 3 n=1 Tax=Coccomyxa viridis TaxID=1274662 RepID=A0ABP1FM35_9CHLO